MARVQEMRGGKDYDADFATRMRGRGPWAELIRQRLDKAAARHGLARRTPPLDASRFRPPAAAEDERQPSLF
jgi:hypothetical protein